ncbi:hypothetical protein [Actinokineospora sp.]|uniref:hypothetical protein n=1 Tax=Actinokineospora sp. TaxID=1872133 RepID=UPI004037A463
MSDIDDAFSDAGRLRAEFVGANGYVLAYGSHATMATRGSDLDLLFVGPPLHPHQLDRLVRAVTALHNDHQLRLDTEVAHEVKLHACPAQINAALALGGFTLDAAGDLHVPPLVVAPWFLNSAPFKLRLILNALTTTHVFLGGDINLYRRHCARADRTLALVALSLLDLAATFTVAEAAAVLVTAADGAAGEDFLGYSPGPALCSTLHRGLAHLITEQVVSTTDGVCFHQYRARHRAVVTRLRRYRRETIDQAWDSEHLEQGGCRFE